MNKIYFVVSYSPEENIWNVEIPKFAPLAFNKELFNETGDGWLGIVSEEDNAVLQQCLDTFNSKMIE